jgi:hypothetical protein
MVVNDLHLMRSILLPEETDPVTFVDPDAVLPEPVPVQPLEAVSRNIRQLFQAGGGVQGEQFPARDALDVDELGAPLIEEQALGFPAPEGADH